MDNLPSARVPGTPAIVVVSPTAILSLYNARSRRAKKFVLLTPRMYVWIRALATDQGWDVVEVWNNHIILKSTELARLQPMTAVQLQKNTQRDERVSPHPPKAKKSKLHSALSANMEIV